MKAEPAASSILWVNGKLLPWGSAVFHASDRGATLGDAVFDTAFCINGKVVEKAAHLKRLHASINFFNYNCQPGHIEEAYGLAEFSSGPGILRVTVSRGPGARGMGHDPLQKAQITAQCTPLPAGIQFSPTVLDIAAFPRNEASPTSRHKTAGYLDSIVAMRSANERGAGDALFQNCRGVVACTTMANIFAIQGKTLATPSLSDGVLAGITRARVLALATKLDLNAVERSLTLAEIEQADEVFATNSLRLIMPVRNLGGANMRYRAEIARAMHDRIAAETGADIAMPDWAS